MRNEEIAALAKSVPIRHGDICGHFFETSYGEAMACGLDPDHKGPHLATGRIWPVCNIGGCTGPAAHAGPHASTAIGICGHTWGESINLPMTCGKKPGHKGPHLATGRRQKNIPEVCEIEGCPDHLTNCSDEVVCPGCSTPAMNGAPMCGCFYVGWLG